MQIASGLLTAGTANIAKFAAETGYGSEATFSRAFKKMVGVPPSAWRHRFDLTAHLRRCKSPSLAPDERAGKEKPRPRYRPGRSTKRVIAGDHHRKAWLRLQRRAR